MDKNSVERSNSFKLLVLDEISKEPSFFKRKNLIRYEIPEENQSLDRNIIASKVTAVWALRNEGAFRTNGDPEFLKDKFKYIFYLEILRPEFNQIYKKYKNSISLDRTLVGIGGNKNEPYPIKFSEKWDRESGIWIIKISEQEDKEIKLGKKGTVTNETFRKLYFLKNKDISSQEIRSHLATELKKRPQEVNIGSGISSIRKWIKASLGSGFNHVVNLTHDRPTKTYKLEVKL